MSDKDFDETITAAALLHDTVEDTTQTSEEIAQALGVDVATLVAEVTENPRIEPYPARKAGPAAE